MRNDPLIIAGFYPSERNNLTTTKGKKTVPSLLNARFAGPQLCETADTVPLRRRQVVVMTQ